MPIISGCPHKFRPLHCFIHGGLIQALEVEPNNSERISHAQHSTKVSGDSGIRDKLLLDHDSSAPYLNNRRQQQDNVATVDQLLHVYSPDFGHSNVGQEDDE
ncbi:hypothetical protein FRC12_016556 [Ceratobasidium sp. 428]|nr:hypothetical protein FRC12_016556 [Ceratobasidium sp. 428]